jgi:uncharacterized protein
MPFDMKNEHEKGLKDKAIAVVGVSEKTEKFGYKIFKDLLGQGYNVQGINIHGGIVLGRQLLKSLEELKSVPDVVITVVPPAITEQVVETAKKLGIKEIWMQPGSESENAIKKAKEYGIKVTHSACIMLSNDLW